MKRMKRFIALLAVTVAAALAAAIPSAAQAAPQLATGHWDQWTLHGWTTTLFKSYDGHVDIWSYCRPKANVVYGQRVQVIWSNAVQKSYDLPCDRVGHWLRRAGVPRGVPVYVHTQSLGPDRALGRTSVYGNGEPL